MNHNLWNKPLFENQNINNSNKISGRIVCTRLSFNFNKNLKNYSPKFFFYNCDIAIGRPWDRSHGSSKCSDESNTQWILFQADKSGLYYTQRKDVVNSIEKCDTLPCENWHWRFWGEVSHSNAALVIPILILMSDKSEELIFWWFWLTAGFQILVNTVVIILKIIMNNNEFWLYVQEWGFKLSKVL